MTDFDWESTRSFIMSYTVFNVPSQYYTNVNALFEIASTGFITSEIINARAFTTPLQQKNSYFIFYLVCRFLLVAICITDFVLIIVKKDRKNILTLDTVSEVSFLLLIIAFQLYSLIMMVI